MRRSELATQLLKAVGVAGIIVAVIALPGLGIAFREFQKSYHKRERDRAYQSLQHLKRRGYVKIEYLADGRMKLSLTKQGKTIIKHLDIEELKIPKPAAWDKKWRVVIFDVPNEKSKNRLAFTDNLKRIGFRMIQKSVWVYPYPCHDEIMILRKFYDIEKFVTYLEASMAEDDDLWQNHFSYLRL